METIAAGADEQHGYHAEWPNDTHPQYDAEEEAARMMGNDGGFDEADTHSLPRGSGTTSLADGNEARVQRKDDRCLAEREKRTAETSPHEQPAKAAKSSGPAAKDGEGMTNALTSTQRAIEYLNKDLKQGPRDGAARLEALKHRVRKRIHAQKDSRETLDMLSADANASTELGEQAKRAKTEDADKAGNEGSGSSSRGSRGDSGAARREAGAELTPQLQRAGQHDDGDRDTAGQGNAETTRGEKRGTGNSGKPNPCKRRKADESRGEEAAEQDRAQEGEGPTANLLAVLAVGAAPAGGRRHHDAVQPPPPAESRTRRRDADRPNSPHRGHDDSSTTRSLDDGHAHHRGDKAKTEASAKRRRAAPHAGGGTHQRLGRPPADETSSKPTSENER